MSITTVGCDGTRQSKCFSNPNDISLPQQRQKSEFAVSDTAESRNPFEDQYKSKSTALMLAGVGTVIPAFIALQGQKGSGLGLSGWLFELGTGIGPGMASFYAEDHMRAVEGIGVRGMLSLSMALTDRSLSRGMFDLVDDEARSSYIYSQNRYDVFFAVGATVYAASMVYNVLTSLDAIEKHNEKVRKMNTFTVKPHLDPLPSGGGVQIGFSLHF